MAKTATVKTRVLIISDTHCAALSKREGGLSTYPTPPFESPLPSADLLIHCGDLTHTGEEGEYHQCLDMLREIDAPVKLVIAGNHDLSLDKYFLLSHREQSSEDEVVVKWQRMRDLWTSPGGRAESEGITFLDEGVHLVDLPNGASVKVYANPYTPEFLDWGFPYEHDEDRFNPPESSLPGAKNIAVKPVPAFSSSERPIDVMMTHGPPWQIMDGTDSGVDAGCKHLLNALARSRPLLHCFGHIHEGWGARKVGWAPQDQISGNAGSVDVGAPGGWVSSVVDESPRASSSHGGLDAVKKERAAFANVSEDAGKSLKRGEETLLVNAAIMDVKYKPINAAWVVDMDFPSNF
ncbi:hypothetical protein MBLNU230_g8479t1 [Neophaeotheca triangularis]